MAKGVSIKFVSYEETVPKVLRAIKLDEELKKHQTILIKPNLLNKEDAYTPVDFADAVVKFCVQHKLPEAQILVVEGSDGQDTMDIFEHKGYKTLAEKYGVALVDLNKTEAELIGDNSFLANHEIMFPSLLKEGFLISLPVLTKHDRHDITGSLSNMLGAYPAKHYKGFFSKTKNKLVGPTKYQIHDIVKCKMPSLALIDAHAYGAILAGQPLEVDKQAAKLLGIDPKSIAHLRIIEESLHQQKTKNDATNDGGLQR